MRAARLLWLSLALCWLSLAGMNLLVALMAPHRWYDPFLALFGGFCIWQAAGLVREALK